MLRRALVSLLVLPLVPLAMSSQAGGDVIPLLGRYIVVLNGPTSPQAVTETATGLGATVEGIFSSLNGFVATLPLLNLGALTHDPRVAFIAPDRPVHLLAEPAPNGVGRIGAAPRTNVDGSILAGPEPRAGVAIIDTGISPHPDLNVVGGVDCANDLLGDLLGSPGYADDHGHGSHVAGTVAAKADGQGVVGVSPGTPLYAVRVFGLLGAGNLSDVICGLDWVAANAAEKNIKVVNMSLGGAGLDDNACGIKDKDPLHAAICRVNEKGVTVVVAAGNSKVDLVDTVPAAYNEVLTVAAMADYDGAPGGLTAPTCKTEDQDDTAADFSNYAVGDDMNHMVAAPGVCIYSTWTDGEYATLSGTSMASPHVAGLVARCIDAGPCAGLSPAQIIEKIRADSAARPADTGFMGDPNHAMESRYYGHLVDASRF